MSLLEEGLGLSACPNALSSQAMVPQVQLLQAVVPLQGWLVACMQTSALSVPAYSGNFIHVHAPLLEEVLTQCPLPEPAALNTYKRVPVSAGQLALLGPAFTGGSWVMFPLHDNDGRGLGFLVGLEPSACPPQAFQYQHAVLCAQAVSAVIMLGSQLGSVHEHAQRVEHRAVTDSLTGVYNRTGWMSRLARLDDTASLPGHDIGILMLDLDYLKVINDNQGHAAGDDLLCRTARAIQSVVRHEDYVGRLGGDEFGVLVSGATPQVLDALMQRMAAVMAKAGIGISMGMALRSEADSLKHVMHLADQRMYDHKRTKPEPVGLEAARKKRALAAGAVPDTMARGSESR